MLTYPATCRLTVPLTVLLTIFLLAMAGLPLALTGCGEKYAATPIDPKTVIGAAMEQYDTNGDGFLDMAELAACPGMLNVIGDYDLNADKKISLEELEDWFESMYGRGISLLSVDCEVTFKKRPLKGAHISFVPEEFMGKGTTFPAEGITNHAGYAVIAIPAAKLTEGLRKYKKVQVGIYRVEITHPTAKIPAKYNTNSELGFEVHPESHGGSHAVYHLDAK